MIFQFNCEDLIEKYSLFFVCDKMGQFVGLIALFNPKRVFYASSHNFHIELEITQ
jgi:hypothetical protein